MNRAPTVFAGRRQKVYLEFWISPSRKPVTRREPVGQQVDHRPSKNLLAEKGAFDLDLRLVQVDVPTALLTAPAVAARFQQVLGGDRRALRPQPYGGLAGGLQQRRQRQQSRQAQRLGQQRQQGVAVVDRPVTLMEVAVVDQQVAELHALVALGAPRDLVARTAPVLVPKDRPARLAHLPVEAGVVRDHHSGVSCDLLHSRVVDPPAGHIGIGDAGQPGDLRRDWLGGLVQLVEGVEQAIDAPAGAVLELQDPELDHLVSGKVGAGGFHVHDKADEGLLVGRVQAVGQRREPAQHAVVARLFEHTGDAVERRGHAVVRPASALSDRAPFWRRGGSVQA